jgi:hypothetical protein
VKLPSTKRDSDAISYKLSGDGLWEDKVRAPGVYERIQPNEVLSLLLNGRRKTIQWWRAGRLLVERPLPYSFQTH